LLEFNGSSWKLYPSPNETIIRSVKAVENEFIRVVTWNLDIGKGKKRFVTIPFHK
jgi:hypothetical protein